MKERYHKNCGLSKDEWQLDKLIDNIKEAPSSLAAIGILRRGIKRYVKLRL